MDAALSFDRFELDPERRRLLDNGEPAKLGARAFDLLAALVERRDRTVSKNELLDLVWPGLVVEENNLQVQISALRKLLGPQAIVTIPGRGYRFTLATTDANGKGRDAPPPVAQAAAAPALPAADAPPLIGRAHELAEVCDLVRRHRLVTLVGAGGIGKTRLARAASQALRDDAQVPVCWVDLASVAEADKVVAAAAQALGASLPPDAPPQRALAQALAEQTVLLVLDNCEHVIDAVAELVDAMLAGAPGVRVLTTSQEPIGLPLEHQLRLGTLEVPSQAEADDVAAVAASGATALLVERARAADPHFALTAENASAVVDICRRLDGIPLAIELAAARVKLLGVAGLRDKLGERFRVLTAGSRLALRRHQTLHAALDWSHGLLTPDEQTVFRRLGVFAGGWTLEAAQQVAVDDEAGEAGDAASPRIDEWAVLEHLGTLVEKSMVVAEGDDRPRYRLLETARAYALERLAQAGETEALTRRHARVMCALLTQAYEARFGEEGTISEADYVALARPEIDNLRAALAWAMAEDPPLAVALASVAASAFALSGLDTEALAMVRRALPLAGDRVEDASAARLWCEAVALGGERALPDEVYLPALARAERGCRHHGRPRALYRVLASKAWRLVRVHEFDAAQPVWDELTALESPQWPGWQRTRRLFLKTHWNSQTGRSQDSAEVFERIAALLPAHGEESCRFRLVLNTAVGSNHRGEWQAASTLLEPLVDGARVQRDSPTGTPMRAAHQIGWAYGHLMLSLVRQRRLDDAGVRLRQALPYWRSGAILHVWLYSAIRLVVAQGRIADAMRLIAAEVRMPNYGRYDALSWGTRQDSLRLVEAAEPDPARRAQWRREGEALDEDALCALCLGSAGAAPPAGRG